MPIGIEFAGLFGSGTLVVLSLISTKTWLPQFPGPTAVTVRSPKAFVAAAAGLEKPVDGVRHELVAREDAAEPARIFVVAGDQAGPMRAALGLTEECNG